MEGKHVADVVEAVAHVVRGEVFRRFEIDAAEVADRVVVLGAIEPPNRDAARILRRCAVDLRQGVRDPVRDEVALFLAWLEHLLLGRHHAGSELLRSGFPVLAALASQRFGLVAIEGETAGGFVRVVAIEAVLLQEGENLLVEGVVRRRDDSADELSGLGNRKLFEAPGGIEFRLLSPCANSGLRLGDVAGPPPRGKAR